MAYAILELENKRAKFGEQKIDAPVGFSFTLLFFMFFDSTFRRDIKMTIFLMFLFFVAPYIMADYLIILKTPMLKLSFGNDYIYKFLQFLVANMSIFVFVYLYFAYNKIFLNNKLAEGYRIIGVRLPYKLFNLKKSKTYTLREIKFKLNLHNNDFASQNKKGA